MDGDHPMLDETFHRTGAQEDPEAAVRTLRRRLNDASPLQGVARSAVRAVEAALDNPVVVGLAIGGAAWLWLSGRDNGAGDGSSALAGTRYEALNRWADDGGPAMAEHELEEHWIAAAEKSSAKLNDALSALDRAERASLEPASSLAKQRAELLARHGRELAEVFRSGLSGLSQAAQDRVAAARRKAWEAGAGAVDRAKESPEGLSVTTFAAGLALSLLIPMSKWERRVMADSRARLVAEAKRALAEELQRGLPDAA
jgi:hypothetical protein